MAVSTRQIVGREEELGAVLSLLDEPEQLPGAALLSGEPGIGKTTVWLAGVDAAAERGYRILSCRPAETETPYGFAALTDLLGSVAADVLPELPPIQRRALETALLLGESERHAEERTVAAGFLGALRLLADGNPVCLAVDDLQWLDVASLAPLRFALARLEQEPVAVLLTVRGAAPDWLRRTVPEERLRKVDVVGLSVGAVHEVLRSRLGVTFSRPTLIRLWETSGGNPFFALELARALQQKGGQVGAGDELPIPSDLNDLLQTRLDRLDEAELEVANVVAALAEPTITLVEAALGASSDAGLAGALEAGILELDGDHLRFTHPLLGSAVASRQTPARRRSLHSRLAEAVPSAEERARHLALATANPDAEVASILEEAAVSAHARGAPTAAAELAEEAVRLTPASDSDDALRRLLFAADKHRIAGDTTRAERLLEGALATAAPGNEHALILTRLAEAEHSPSAIALYHKALEEAEDLALRATIHLRFADFLGTEGIQRVVEHVDAALRASSSVADPALRCRALAAYMTTHFFAGRGIATKTTEEAIALERSLTEWPLVDGPTISYAYQLYWSADIARGRELFQELEAAARARNEPAMQAWALLFLGHIAWRAGEWQEADRYTATQLDLHAQLGEEKPQIEFPAAFIAAHRGRVTEARARAERALTLASAIGIGIAESGHCWVLGFLELSLGDAKAALPHLRRSYEIRHAFMLEPAQRLELGDLLEALIAVGELDEAEGIIGTWEPRARAVDRAWALAILARGRGLLLAARGDLDGALASFDRALSEHARSTDPFHHARTLLALGRTQRRAKQRSAARATLEDALARFEQLGAPLWAEQTRAELARIGGRAPSRGELTAAERRVAALVAEGRTNREVAAALFLGERTVASHLTRIYAKLGIRSRTELARELHADGPT